ncbi:S1/P1 nuclease [Schizophyllum commune]
MKRFFLVLLTLALAAFSVHAFGTEGNQAVGYIAMQFLAPRARAFKYAFSLGPAATWANAVKSQPAYQWSAELHFINAIDATPKYCEVDQQDCTNGRCILTAIAYYTTRVVDISLPAAQRQEALKFLDSFFGDLGQPLNVEAFEHGGHDIPARCFGKQSNLYDVWDSGIITQLLKRKYSRSVARWVGVLVGRIRTGQYKDKTSQWLSCSSTMQPEGSESRERAVDEDLVAYGAAEITPLQCPLLWASESNWLVCFDVLSYTSVNPEVCTGTYYDNAVKDIEIQVTTQGYRLAAWLNVLFDGSTHLP